jgi:hypothetical protein
MRKTASILVALCIVLCLVIAPACKRNDNVTYEVTGTAESVDVKVSNEKNVMEEYRDIPLPWRMDYGGFEENNVYLYAYNRGEEGSVTVTIYVNGQVFKSLTTEEPYGNVTIFGEK